MRGTGKAKSSRQSTTSTGKVIEAGNLVNEVFEGIIEGIRQCGDEPVINTSTKNDQVLPTNRYAIMFGYGRRLDENTKHLIQNFRYSILEHQKANKGHTFCFDGGFFKGLGNYKYYRFGLGSPLYDGEFLNKNSPNDRWNIFKQEFNIPYSHWRNDGDHILICTQPDRGYSMNLQPTINLIREWIPKLRTFTDKKIIIKPHPNGWRNHDAETAVNNLAKSQPNIIITDSHSNLYDYFEKASHMVTWNSTVAVESVTFGIPTFTFHNMGFAYDVTDHTLDKFNTPTQFNRDQWLADIHYAQWSAEELATGELWDRYKKYISDIEQGLQT